MQATHDVQFGNSEMQRFTGLLNNLFDGKLETIRISLLASEGTELATQDAVIGIIDVTIDDVARSVTDLSLPGEIGDRSDRVQILALEKAQCIGFGNSLACGNLVVEVPQFAALNKELHEL
jgi:hypothetical protein